MVWNKRDLFANYVLSLSARVIEIYRVRGAMVVCEMGFGVRT